MSRAWPSRLPRPEMLRRPWTLRARLLAALLALLAAVCVVVGLVSVVALRHYLLGQLDQQLVAAGGRSSNAFEQPPDNRPAQHDTDSGERGPTFLFAPGQSAGTLGAHLASGQLEVAVLDSTGTGRQVSVAAGPVLTRLPADGRPRTRALTGLGDYRLLAAHAPDGDTIITGLPTHDLTATVYRLSAVITAVAIIGLAGAAVVGTVIVRLALRPLRRVTATATRVSELPLERGEVAIGVRVPDTDPRTEVGQVGAAFNRMLRHVATALAARHASETRVRQFVADASHELRTPLAAIRGYAELTRRAGDHSPVDVAHSLDRVEAEATRMTALVEDLLLLARLDAGRPVEPESVDLTALVIDAVSDAHAAGGDHPIQLHLPDDPVMVVGQLGRLHQMLANLLTNARTHTPPGTKVTVTLTAPGDGAALTVADNGPGIPADLLPRVFERFARGDTSRSRAAGSTGLGLAIAAAVVHAHHGDIQVTSRPGCTAFTVQLPRRAGDQGDP